MIEGEEDFKDLSYEQMLRKMCKTEADFDRAMIDLKELLKKIPIGWTDKK